MQVENIWMCVCTIPGLELRRALTCRWQVVLREPTSSPGIVVSASITATKSMVEADHTLNLFISVSNFIKLCLKKILLGSQYLKVAC